MESYYKVLPYCFVLFHTFIELLSSSELMITFKFIIWGVWLI